MGNVIWGSRLQARDRCVLYFPNRKKNRIIMGEEVTHRRWGEQWYQVRIEPIAAESRLEGDNAIDLGRGLCCDAVAKLEAQIDNGKDLEQSISKIVKHFMCVPTNNQDVILGQAAFAEPLKNVLRSMVKNVILLI